MWSQFGSAYRSAIQSLRNRRTDYTVAREEQSRLYGTKRPASSKNLGAKKKKLVTWTQKFVCLSDTDCVKVPNAAYMYFLEAAGPGEKKLVIPDVDCSALDLNEVVVEAFPKLIDGGGFEFLRCIPNTRDLKLIDHNTPPRLLKQKVGNGRLFIRPIQKHLSMESITDEQEPSLQVRNKIHCFYSYVIGGTAVSKVW